MDTNPYHYTPATVTANSDGYGFCVIYANDGTPYRYAHFVAYRTSDRFADVTTDRHGNAYGVSYAGPISHTGPDAPGTTRNGQNVLRRLNR